MQGIRMNLREWQFRSRVRGSTWKFHKIQFMATTSIGMEVAATAAVTAAAVEYLTD